jgi:hypothetical protein
VPATQQPLASNPFLQVPAADSHPHPRDTSFLPQLEQTQATLAVSSFSSTKKHPFLRKFSNQYRYLVTQFSGDRAGGFKRMSSDVFGGEDSSKVKAVLDSVLASQTYSHGKTSGWVEAIADGVLAALTMEGFKLVVDVLVMEKGETGFKSYSSARWNEKTDGVLLVRFENETIRATATIWALK